MNITVYLGAKEGNDPGLKKAVQEWRTRIRTTTKYRSEANGDLPERKKVTVDSLEKKCS